MKARKKWRCRSWREMITKSVGWMMTRFWVEVVLLGRVETVKETATTMVKETTTTAMLWMVRWRMDLPLPPSFIDPDKHR